MCYVSCCVKLDQALFITNCLPDSPKPLLALSLCWIGHKFTCAVQRLGRTAHLARHAMDTKSKLVAFKPNVNFLLCVMQRFGRIVQLYVSAMMLVSMGTALTVEYTTVGSLFSQIIGSTQIPIVIIIGVVASVYTAYGGLHVSLITDQVQVRAFVQNNCSEQAQGRATQIRTRRIR